MDFSFDIIDVYIIILSLILFTVLYLLGIKKAFNKLSDKYSEHDRLDEIKAYFKYKYMNYSEGFSNFHVDKKGKDISTTEKHEIEAFTKAYIKYSYFVISIIIIIYFIIYKLFYQQYIE